MQTHTETNIAKFPSNRNKASASVPRWAEQITDAEGGMNVVRMEMYNYDLKLLAIRVGVSRSCLDAMRSGRTAWPRPTTLFPLIDILGIRMYFAKKG